MHFKPAAVVAALLTSRAASLALPQPDSDVVIGGSDTTGDQMADLIAAYEQVEDAISDPVTAPSGATGTIIIPEEDTTEISAAAAEDATHGGLEKRGVFKRGTCAPQVSKFTTGPDVSALDAAQWKEIDEWNEAALAASTPDGYYQVRNWRALSFAAVAQLPRGSTSDLSSYNTAACAAKCSAISGCSSFNIFFERAPTKDLDKTACPSSPAQTVVKCLFWGLPLEASEATNPGQVRGTSFFTSKAGSNAYNVIPATPEGFSGPVNFGVASIKATPELQSTYMGIQTFADVSYNPQLCADSCNAKSADNRRIAREKGLTSYRECNFFNAYVAYKNDASPLFTCTYYTRSFGPEFATNVKQFNAAGDRFTKGSSNGFTLDGPQIR